MTPEERAKTAVDLMDLEILSDGHYRGLISAVAAAIRAERKETIEECARLAENYGFTFDHTLPNADALNHAMRGQNSEIATQIRKLSVGGRL